MFCPRCGQQQASDEVRFCSRCGLQLDALAEFVESGGRLASRDASEDLPALTPRQRGTRMGLLILVAGLIFDYLIASKITYCPRKSIMSVLACPDTTVTGCPCRNFRLIRFSRIQVLLLARSPLLAAGGRLPAGIVAEDPG